MNLTIFTQQRPERCKNATDGRKLEVLKRRVPKGNQNLPVERRELVLVGLNTEQTRRRFQFRSVKDAVC